MIMKKNIFFGSLLFLLLIALPVWAVTLPTTTETGLSDKSINDILTNVLSWMLGIIGVVALISFAVSGIMYLVSTGNDDLIKKAKSTMQYSIMGVVVALAALVIIQFIDSALNAKL